MEQENEYGNYIPTSKAELNSYISDVQIYLYFFGPFNEDQFYHSPFRKEKFGSFKFKYDNGKLCWVDYGDDFRLKDSIDFVQKKFSLSFYQALEYIYLTVVLGKDIPLEQNIKKRNRENHQKFFIGGTLLSLLKLNNNDDDPIDILFEIMKLYLMHDYFDRKSFNTEEINEINISEIGREFNNKKNSILLNLNNPFLIYDE